MPRLDELDTFTKDGDVRMVVETPRGSQAKISYDPETQTFVLSKALVLGLHYPFDWGFIPSTLAEDGDPIDALVLHEAATYPGVVLPCELIGILEIVEREKKGKPRRNDRLVAIPSGSPRQDALSDARKLPKTMRDDLESFFRATVAKKPKGLDVLGWRGPAEARRRLEDARARFAEKDGVKT